MVEPTVPGPGDAGPRAVLRLRRIAFATLVGASSIALVALMAATLFPAGADAIGVAMLVMFALTLPWTTIGFWNAVIGLSLMTFARDPAEAVAPGLRDAGSDGAIESPTA